MVRVNPVGLPSQTGNSGKMLTTDGSSASWTSDGSGLTGINGRFRGIWSGAVWYYASDIVVLNGIAYFSLDTNLNQSPAPGGTAHWTELPTGGVPIYASLTDLSYLIITGATVTYGETLAKFEVVYLATDGKVYKIDPTEAGNVKLPSSPNIYLILTAGNADDQKVAMLEGFFRNDSLAAGFSAASPFYGSSAAAGALSVTAPSVPGQAVQVLGAVTQTAKICYFRPTGVTVTVGRYTTPDSAASGDLTPNVDQYSFFIRTAQAAAMAVNAPTGTPTNGQIISMRFQDNGTTRAITFNSIYRDGTGLDILDGSNIFNTTINVYAYFQFMYNSDDTKWDLVGAPGGY